MIRQILIASDHAGFELKQEMIRRHPELPWKDLGTNSKDSVDYPDFAAKLCEEWIETTGFFPAEHDALESGVLGLLICGSGQGMNIRANRYPEIRAALCWNTEITKLSRQHNNANILCLPARFLKEDEAQKIIQAFVGTKFEGGRHSVRVAKLS